jgi:hypothetical protein
MNQFEIGLPMPYRTPGRTSILPEWNAELAPDDARLPFLQDLSENANREEARICHAH